jgi:tripartite-type tricarboxylate transporter receptor subunit TctC
MNSSRRQFLYLAASAMASPAVARKAWAQTYPARPVRILVGFAAGGATDVAARLIGQWLSDRSGQPFVIENRPGAGGNVATEAAARSAPDGHTLLGGGVNDAVNATLFEKLNFNFIRDLAPVAGIMRAPNVMVVNPSVPAKTVTEFIAYAKANPGKINMASAGNGTGPHVAGELFKLKAGVDIVHVPYRGGAAAIPDLLTGQVQLMFTVPALTVEHIRAGKLRALAVTTTARWERLQELPTVDEFLPGYEASNWFGIVTPKNTPDKIVDKLNREINAGLADYKTRIRLADLGGAALSTSPNEFGRLIGEETEKWGKVIRAANIKPE